MMKICSFLLIATVAPLLWDADFAWADTPPGANAPIKMNLPCISSDQSCSISFLRCNSVTTQIESLIESIIKQKIDFLYKGLDAELLTSNNSGQTPKGAKIQTPICNLSEGEVTNENASHNPSTPSCGNFKHYIMTGVDTKTNGYGTRENAYTNGFYVQALKCFQAQVFHEMETQQAIQVQYLTSAATLFNQQYESLTQGITTGSQRAVCQLPAACQMNQDQCAQASTSGQDNSCQRIALCKLQAAQQGFLGAYAHTAYLEIANRAKNSWISKLPTISDQVYNSVEIPCRTPLEASCNISAKTFGFVQIDPQCIADGMNACYPQKYPDFMKGLLQIYYPSNGSCR